MNNISNLFENLMTYNETNRKKIDENDSTLLNLTVELPTNSEEITPEDVKVDVGVMAIDTDGAEGTSDPEVSEDENNETDNDESTDVTPDDENESENDNSQDNEEEPNKEESLKLRKEAIRRKRLEAKQLRESKKDCCGEDDCECESCKAKKEAKDVEIAKDNIRKRVANFEECNNSEIKKETSMRLDTKSLNKLMTEFVKENYKNIDKITITKAVLENRMLKLEGVITNINGKTETISITNRGFNSSKLEGKRFIMDFKDTSNTFSVIKENLKQPFVFTCTLVEGVLKFEELKYSYKTMHESKTVEIFGKCVLTEGLFDGKTKDFVRKEFNNLSDLGKSHMIDDGLSFKIETDDVEKLKSNLKSSGYKESSNGDFYRIVDKQKMLVTFKIQGEMSAENPEYVVTFSARKEDIKRIKESSLNENANQVAKFNEIVEKIKAAKTPNDLSNCKDELDDANLGDTLLSAAQMVWDDVNSKMKASE